MRTDGSDRARLNKEESRYVTVIGDWIYYYHDKSDFENTENLTVDGSIYKMRTDGTEKTSLLDEYIHVFMVSGGVIFYSSMDGIFRMDTDGGNVKQIVSGSNVNFFDIDDDNEWIYYVNSSERFSLYKIKTDGSENARVEYSRSVSVNVDGDWIYYITSEDVGGLRPAKIKPDGSGKMFLSDKMSASIFVIGDWVYYLHFLDFVSGEMEIYKVRKDGSEEQLVG
jgi:uncharacterized protein YchJ